MLHVAWMSSSAEPIVAQGIGAGRSRMPEGRFDPERNSRAAAAGHAAPHGQADRLRHRDMKGAGSEVFFAVEPEAFVC